MQSSASVSPREPWISLWVVAGLSLLGQLALCQFFSFGINVPVSIDIDPSNLWKNGYQWPPTGQFLTLNWLGVSVLPPPLNPFTLAAHLPIWWFFTTYAPFAATAALLMMAAFLREFGLSRPASLFGAVVYAWQGDLLTFVFPGHYAYITTWFFFAAAAWGALRIERTGHWAYGIVSGVSCGTMVGLAADRGAIASLLIAALYLAPAWENFSSTELLLRVRRLALCVGMAFVVALGGLLGLFQSNIEGVKLGGSGDRGQTYDFVTQFSLGPAETLTYLVPGFFGWHINNQNGPYWGWIGEWPGWPKDHQGEPNLNLAISTTGTIATTLALIGVFLLLPGSSGRLFGAVQLTPSQKIYGRVLLALGVTALVFSWGWHTPLYRLVYELPLMDKWRNPLKWLGITNFALVTLSALGMQHLLQSIGNENPQAPLLRRRLGGFVAGMVVLVGMGLVASVPFAIRLEQVLQADGFDAGALPNIMSMLHVSLAAALISLLVFALLLIAVWRPTRLRGWISVNPWLNRSWQRMWDEIYLPVTLAIALTVASTMQLAWVVSNFIKPAELAWMTSSNAFLDALKKEGPAVRVSAIAQDPVINELMQNQFQGDGISCLEISAASRILDDYATFLKTFQDDPVRLYFLAGVKNLAMPQQMVAQLKSTPALMKEVVNANGYDIAPTDSPNVPSHAIVQLRDFLAKATPVPSSEVVPDLGTMLKRMQDPKWNPRETLFLNAPAPEEWPPVGTYGLQSSGQVELQTYTWNEIDFAARSPAPTFILINDQFDPDWSAQVNGKPVPILRADYFFRAVQVPAGVSQVTMHFSAHYHVLGLNLPTALVSAFSDGSMLAAWIIAGIALRRREPASD